MSATTSPLATVHEHWTATSSESATTARIRHWAERHAVFSHAANLDEVFQLAHHPDHSDAVYLALTTEHRRGDDLATVAILQTLTVWTHDTARRCQHRFDSREDTEAAIVTGLLEAIQTLPEQRTTRVRQYLVMRCLNAVAGRQQKYGTAPREAATDEVTMTTLVAATPESASDHPLGVVGEALDLLAWALDSGALTKDEVSLLVRLYSPETDYSPTIRTDLADELGISQNTLDKRASRAVAKLRSAVLST